MRTIINQNPTRFALPDLRNLGTILRILLAVNAMVFIAAVASEVHWNAISDAWLQMSSMVEPQLLFELLILYAIAPWLERSRYRVGAINRPRADLRGHAWVQHGAGCDLWRGDDGGAAAAAVPRAHHGGSGALLFCAAHQRRYPSHCGGPSPGAAGAHPSALSVQQHQRRCSR